MCSSRAAVRGFGLWLALAAGASIAGCTPEICGRSSDCASGLMCTTVGACVVPPVDAGRDAGSATSVDDATTTTIRDADGDALGIEPIDAAPIDARIDAAPIDARIDAAPAADANTIDAPPDNVAIGSKFEGAWSCPRS